jgi:hypothetical protein
VGEALSYLLVQKGLDFAPDRPLDVRVAVPDVPVQVENLDVPLVALTLLFCGEFEQETFSAFEDLKGVLDCPVLELVLAALHEDGHNILPIRCGQQRRVVCNVESCLLPFHHVFNLNFAMMGAVVTAFTVFTVDKEFFNVTEAQIACLRMFRYDDHGEFFTFEDGVDSQFAFLYFGSIISGMDLK